MEVEEKIRAMGLVLPGGSRQTKPAAAGSIQPVAVDADG
jgi:hypothetical protein